MPPGTATRSPTQGGFTSSILNAILQQCTCAALLKEAGICTQLAVPIDGPDDAILSHAAQEVTEYIEVRRAKTLHGELLEYYSSIYNAATKAAVESELACATRELNTLAGELDDIGGAMAVVEETDPRDNVHDMFSRALHNVQWRIRRYHWTSTADPCKETVRNTIDDGRVESAFVTFHGVQRECIRVFDFWRAAFQISSPQSKMRKWASVNLSGGSG